MRYMFLVYSREKESVFFFAIRSSAGIVRAPFVGRTAQREPLGVP